MKERGARIMMNRMCKRLSREAGIAEKESGHVGQGERDVYGPPFSRL